MKTLCIASKNRGKISELLALPALQGLTLHSAAEFPDIPAPEENGSDFYENALIKAKYYSEQTRMPALADDSGLCVDALNGAPGLHSARYAEEAGGVKGAFDRLKHDIEASSDPLNFSAYFISVLCLYMPDGSFRHFEGKTSGVLTFPPRGSGGFGYDPIFIPEGYAATFGELPKSIKAEESHRAKALRLLAAQLSGPAAL